MAGQNIKGRGQRPNSLEGGGARYLISYLLCINENNKGKIKIKNAVFSMDGWVR